jgi:hypothetical protein
MPKRERDRKYLARVRQLPCVVCGTTFDVEAHHKTGAGGALKDSDYNTFPLCPIHHIWGGPGVAIHAGDKTWQKIHGTQDDHIKETQRKLGYEPD